MRLSVLVPREALVCEDYAVTWCAVTRTRLQNVRRQKDEQLG